MELLDLSDLLEPDRPPGRASPHRRCRQSHDPRRSAAQPGVGERVQQPQAQTLGQTSTACCVRSVNSRRGSVAGGTLAGQPRPTQWAGAGGTDRSAQPTAGSPCRASTVLMPNRSASASVPMDNAWPWSSNGMRAPNWCSTGATSAPTQRLPLEPPGVPRSVSLNGNGRRLAVQVSRNGRWDVDLIRLP